MWKLLAAVGVALMAYAWADEECNQAELFSLGVGVATAGVLFWRDPAGPHAPPVTTAPGVGGGHAWVKSWAYSGAS